MRVRRSAAIGALLVVGSLGLSGCTGPSTSTTGSGTSAENLVALAGPPAPPTGFTLRAKGNDRVIASWNRSDEARTSYRVGIDDRDQVTLPLGTTTYTFDGLASGRKHTASISARNTSGRSRIVSAGITLAPDVKPTPVTTTSSKVPVPQSTATTVPPVAVSATPIVLTAKAADRRACDFWKPTSIDITNEISYLVTDRHEANSGDVDGLLISAHETDLAADRAGTTKLRKSLEQVAAELRVWAHAEADRSDAGTAVEAMGYPLSRCADLAK
jgi:hypothetical protein